MIKNQIKTVLLLGILSGILLLIGQLIGGFTGLTTALVLAIVMNVGSSVCVEKSVSDAKNTISKDALDAEKALENVQAELDLGMQRIEEIKTKLQELSKED